MRQKPSKEKQLEYQRRYHAKNKGKKALWNKLWIENNRERYYALKYNFRDRNKKACIAHYSNGTMECNYCGFNNIYALCLDHINNDGAKWRKDNFTSSRGNNGGSNTFNRVKQLGFPEGFQVLCANCNLIKEIQRKMDNRMLNSWYKKGHGRH